MPSVALARLRAQHLVGPPLDSPIDVVRWLGAVQAQDYRGAKWGVAQRARGASDADLDRLVDEGLIVRTHVMRPTWHFVLPEDVGWLLALTGPRVMAGIAGRHRQLELDSHTITRSRAAFEKALAGGRSMTREELGQVLVRSRIAPDGQRLPHLLLAAELAGLVVSGPRRGREQTFALMAERAPRARVLDAEAAAGELARRYFTSHGPALVRDFVWWSGLTQAMAVRGIAAAGRSLVRRSIDGLEYWFDPSLDWRPRGAQAVHILPNFDEYTVAYADRSAMLDPAFPFRPELFSFSSILSNVVVAGGRLRAGWRRVQTRSGVRVEVRPIAPLSVRERSAVEAAGELYSRFLGVPVEITWVDTGA